MPPQYQIRMVVRRVTGPNTFAISLPNAGHDGLVVLDGGGGSKSGLIWIDGRNEPANETFYRKSIFAANKPTEVICRVRRHHIHVTVDGKTIVQWCGDPARLALDDRYWKGVPRGRLMFLSRYSEYRISELELRPILHTESDQYRLRGKPASPSESVALIEHGQGTGSGFLAAPNLLVTNYHVVADALASELKVVFPNNNDSLKVHSVVYEDEARDLAILSVKTNRAPLPVAHDGYVPKGESVKLRGNPSVGGGVIIRDAVVDGNVKAVLRVGELDLLQIDANINPGSSGGPVTNRLGQVVGVTVMKATREGERMLREGLRRLDESLAGRPRLSQQKGIALAIPAYDLAKALNEVHSASGRDAARRSRIRDNKVIMRRLAMLAALRTIGALASATDQMRRQELLLRNTGRAGDFIPLPPAAEAAAMKRELEEGKLSKIIAQCEDGLSDQLKEINNSDLLSPDAKRLFRQLAQRVAELESMAKRPGIDYRKFSGKLERIQDSLVDNLKDVRKRLEAE